MLQCGLALLPILLYLIVQLFLLVPIVYSIFLLSILSLAYLLYRSFSLVNYWLLIACSAASIVAIIIYIALFIAYLSDGIVLPLA